MKKILAFILAGSMLIFSSISAAAAVETPAAATTAVVDSNYNKQLTEEEVKIYNLILENFMAKKATFAYTFTPAKTVTDGGVSLSNMAYRAYEAVYRDHPEIFWVTKLGGMKVAVDLLDASGAKQATKMNMQVTFFEPEKVAQKQAKMEAAITQILEDAPSDVYKRVKYFHDTLTAQSTYDMEAKAKPDSYPEAYEAYGALVNHKAVCEGYAKAFKLLCDRSNIPCVLVGGVADKEAHMWNYVQVGGKYYLLDATFDDPINGDPVDTYLLKGSATTKSHTPGSGFLQGFNSGFKDPALNPTDYDPTKDKSGTVTGPSVTPPKERCLLTYSGTADGGNFTVTFTGIPGALDRQQEVLNGVVLTVNTFPKAGYAPAEIKAEMAGNNITAADADTMTFTVSNDCKVSVSFKKTN